MGGHVWGDVGVVGFVGGVGHDVLDDAVEEAAPQAGRQAVGVDDGAELPRPVGQRGQPFAFGDDVVVEFGV
jgi:hypothetical protein